MSSLNSKGATQSAAEMANISIREQLRFYVFNSFAWTVTSFLLSVTVSVDLGISKSFAFKEIVN